MLINHLPFSIGEVKGNNCLHISIFAHVCFILQVIHHWKALIFDNNGRGLILKFATSIFLKRKELKTVFSEQSGCGQPQSWATPNSSIAGISVDVLFRGRGLHKFYATSSFRFFIWVSPLHILNAPVYLTINYKYNSDDSWVPRNGFLNNYWPHFFYSLISILFFQSRTPKPLFDQVL